MKKNFLKFGLFLAMGLTTAIFYSCDKDDKDKDGDGGNASTVNASNVINSSDKIATVKVMGYWENGRDLIVEATYENDGFKLNLPETLDDKYLYSSSEDDMEGVTFSDNTVRSFGLEWFSAYDEDNKEIGWFSYASADPDEDVDNSSVAIWIYVDKNVTINGENKDVDTFDGEEYVTISKFDNVTLKKGWNIYYLTYTYNESAEKETYTYTYSNKKPSNLNWYFVDNGLDWEYLDPSIFSTSLKSSKILSAKKPFSTKLNVRKKK